MAITKNSFYYANPRDFFQNLITKVTKRRPNVWRSIIQPYLDEVFINAFNPLFSDISAPNSFNTDRGTSCGQCFDPGLFVRVLLYQSTPLPANCLLGPSNNDHARGFGPGCIRHQTHRPNVKASIFLNLPTLLWRVSVHPGIDLLLPSYCAYIVRENRGRVTTTPLRTYTILCSNPH